MTVASVRFINTIITGKHFWHEINVWCINTSIKKTSVYRWLGYVVWWEAELSLHRRAAWIAGGYAESPRGLLICKLHVSSVLVSNTCLSVEDHRIPKAWPHYMHSQCMQAWNNNNTYVINHSQCMQLRPDTAITPMSATTANVCS